MFKGDLSVVSIDIYVLAMKMYYYSRFNLTLILLMVNQLFEHKK